MESSDQYSMRADECLKEAHKVLEGSFFGKLISNKADRAEQAIQLFKQAATNFKLAKRWDDAALAYLECVQCDQITKSNQSGQYYLEAANMKEKINTAQCIKLLEMSISDSIQKNNLQAVAKIQKRIAQIYERDGEYTLATKYYRQSAQKYAMEQNQTSSYNSCMLKIVDIGIYAPVVQYGQLIKILEEVSQKYMKNKLTAPSAKQLYFKSVLLFLANDDSIGAAQSLQRYINNDPTFYQSLQHKFCLGLIKSIKEGNLTLFSEQSFKFNEIIPLDKWKTTILTRIKETIPDANNTALLVTSTMMNNYEVDYLNNQLCYMNDYYQFVFFYISKLSSSFFYLLLFHFFLIFSYSLIQLISKYVRQANLVNK